VADSSVNPQPFQAFNFIFRNCPSPKTDLGSADLIQASKGGVNHAELAACDCEQACSFFNLADAL
jgi:hypothetical protein